MTTRQGKITSKEHEMKAQAPHTKFDIDTKFVPQINHCYCGCGLPQENPDASFLSGHDAKMVSDALKTLMNHGGPTNEDNVREIANNRFHASPRLRDKFLRAVDNKAAKGAGRGRWVEMDDVKVGRWTYPARAHEATGEHQRNTKRDGSGEWVTISA